MDEPAAHTKNKRGVPKRFYETPSGKFQSRIQWGCKSRFIGTFDTAEQAFVAYMSMKKDLAGFKQSALDEIDAAFDAAKKKAVEAVGILV